MSLSSKCRKINVGISPDMKHLSLQEVIALFSGLKLEKKRIFKTIGRYLEFSTADG